jgi:geranylgeranyl diphosphate synthase type I
MTMAAPTAESVLRRAAEQVAPAIEAVVARLSPELRPAAEHHLAGGGKRVRAGLVLVGAEAAGASAEVGIPGAVAIELVHNFSLVHDDIMDGDTERRHRPTVWAEFGTGQAIIVGDALATLSLEILLEEPTPERVRAAHRLTVDTQSMIAGQAADLAFETRSDVTVEDCLSMLEGKTGALLSCSCALGAILAGAPATVVDALGEFGRHLGISFQAVDDILGIWGDPSVTGKPAGNDLLAHKKSLPVVAALSRAGGNDELRRLLAGDLPGDELARATALIEASGARELVMGIADDYLGRALAALDRVELVEGPREELVSIAHFVTERDR